MPRKPSKTDPFVEETLDRLAPLGDVRVRAMFGGHGFYLRDDIFACHLQGRLYLKCDEATRTRFQAKGSKPFRPLGEKGPTLGGYWEVPLDVWEDPEALREAVAASVKGRRKAADAPRGK